MHISIHWPVGCRGFGGRLRSVCRHTFLGLLLATGVPAGRADATEAVVTLEPYESADKQAELPVHLRERLHVYQRVRITETQAISETRPPILEIEMGHLLGGSGKQLPERATLESFAVLAPNAELVAADRDGHRPIDVRFAAYRGALDGGGWINLYFTSSGVRGLLNRGSQLYVLEPADVGKTTAATREHLLYRLDALEHHPEQCGAEPHTLAPDLQLLLEATGGAPAGKVGAPASYTAKLALETDYRTYLSFGRDTKATMGYLLSMAASASQLYEEGVGVRLEVVYARVWTTEQDPYSDGTAELVLREFRAHWAQHMDHVERDLALLQLRNGEGSGRAYVDALCSNEYAYAVAGDHLMLTAHEIGHVFGSPHTHSCSWPAGPGGTLGPIDGCAPAEGGCGVQANSSGLGTIMSYCAVREGFHPLVRAAIRSRLAMRSCVGPGTTSTNILSGRVWHGDVPVSNVRVMAITQTEVGGLPIFSTVTDAHGRYSLDLPPNDYRIIAATNGLLIRSVASPEAPSSSVLVQVPGIDVENVDFRALELHPDGFEPDNDRVSATPIETDGAIRVHSVHHRQDEDHFRFDARVGETYEISLHAHGDPLFSALPALRLEAPDGRIPFAQTEGTGTAVRWLASETGAISGVISSATEGFYGLSVTRISRGVSTDVHEHAADLSNALALFPNYPNPFHATTTIPYEVPDRTRVVIAILNALGQEVASLVDDVHVRGHYRVSWNASAHPSGPYICRMETERAVRYRTLVLLK